MSDVVAVAAALGFIVGWSAGGGGLIVFMLWMLRRGFFR